MKSVDATTDTEIQKHIDQDNTEAMLEMGEFIRGVRARVGMSQTEFSQRIGISVDTLRNWEQGRRYPTGTARALLRIIDRAPEVAIAALQR
ncbi:MAG: helix-turn-helix domain-containing protein [Spirochaeta sp.]|nr:helix-turn-helix domain-containing protein [Spirochaeta sp.]